MASAASILGPSLGGDDRMPYSTITLPNMLPDFGLPDCIHETYMNSIAGRTVGILLPNMQFWHHLTQAIGLTTLFAAIMSRIVYTFVIQRRGTLLSRMVGFSVIVACILFPYTIITMLNAQNLVVKFSLCGGPAVFMFRTSEAIFGFSPPGVERSELAYMAYYALAIELELDRKTARPIETNKEEMKTNLTLLAGNFVQLSVLMSLFASSAYEPFEGRPGETEGDDMMNTSPLHYLRLGHLGNCFVAAYLFQQMLGLYGFLMTAITHFSTGYKTTVPMRNPLLEATSPSDFWGRRWNTLVHGVLKRGVYKPVRKYGSALAASLAAFVASGLFHEWIVHVMSFKRDCEETCYNPLIGSNAAFFVWNAGVIMVETLLRRNVYVEKIGRYIPRLGITFLVVMTSLPVAHWFADPYIRQGFFDHYQQGYPMLTFV